MKKIIVFGSTGTIGKQLVSQALNLGYEVTAFARDKSKITQKHQYLHIFEGDVLDFESVHQAIAGHEIVFCALGSGKSRKSTVRSAGTKNIIQAMEKHGIQRFICQTTLGLGDSNSNLNFFWKYIMFGWFLKSVFLDHELQEEYIVNSQLDWTIIRPAAFTDGKKTGKYKHGFPPSSKKLTLKISRADVAQFMLEQIKSLAYLHQRPGLSY